ncbi:MAG: hypothetical protein PVJ09_04550 [Candidatus Woesebacteria bacterium]|jgi:hypothetical protein
MINVLFLIPVLAAIGALLLNRHNCKKEILKFDLVQFIYAFILSPLFFIWFKSFLFYLLKQDLGLNLSLTELFVFDTFYAVIFLFVYAFIVIHALTKSFENKRFVDPLVDIFKHSEVIHLWISHLIMFVGMMILLTFLSVINVYFPLKIEAEQGSFYFLLFLSLPAGVVTFATIWIANFTEYKFMKLMKLFFAIFFVIHVVLYFVFDPAFNIAYLMYWFVFIIFVICVMFSFFFEKSEKTMSLFDRFSNKYKKGWRGSKKKFLLTK